MGAARSRPPWRFSAFGPAPLFLLVPFHKTMVFYYFQLLRYNNSEGHLSCLEDFLRPASPHGGYTAFVAVGRVKPGFAQRSVSLMLLVL